MIYFSFSSGWDLPPSRHRDIHGFGKRDKMRQKFGNSGNLGCQHHAATSGRCPCPLERGWNWIIDAGSSFSSIPAQTIPEFCQFQGRSSKIFGPEELWAQAECQESLPGFTERSEQNPQGPRELIPAQTVTQPGNTRPLPLLPPVYPRETGSREFCHSANTTQLCFYSFTVLFNLFLFLEILQRIPRPFQAPPEELSHGTRRTKSPFLQIPQVTSPRGFSPPN